MAIKSNSNNLYHTSYYIIFFSFFFLIAPFFSILLQAIFLFINKKVSENYFYVLIISISIFLGLINCTIKQESDIVTYLDWYRTARDTNFFNYAFGEKEFMFSILTYLLYYMLSGSGILYIFFITFLTYIFFLISIYKFYLFYNIDKTIIISAIFIGAFFPQLFSVSNNIIRQVLATSIMFYFIVMYVFYNKNYFYLLILSIFIHTSVVLFLPALFVNKMTRRLTVKKILFIIIPFLTLILLTYKDILHVISNHINIPFLSYTLLKLEAHAHSNYPLPEFISVALIVVLTFIVILKVYISPTFLIKKNYQYRHFTLIFLLFVFVFALTFDLTQISHRLIFYSYYFLPFIFPFLTLREGHANNFYPVFLISFIIIYFIYKLHNSVWTYAPNEYVFTFFIPYIFLG